MKFFRRGTSHAIFAPTIANIQAPTQAEITAGTPLDAAVVAIENFDTSTSRISQATLKYQQNSQIDGEQTFGDASMTLLEDDGTAGVDSTEIAAAYTALTDGTVGYIILSPGATDATKKGEVWPVKIGANNRQWSLDNEMAKYQVAFAITSAPAKNAVFAA